MTTIDTDKLADYLVHRVADALEDGVCSLNSYDFAGGLIEGNMRIDSSGIRAAFARRLYAFVSERGRIPKVDIELCAGGYTAGTSVDIICEMRLY